MTNKQLLLNEISGINDLSKAILLRPIVPIDEWVDSPYYLGDTCYQLYPKYKQHLKSIFDSERDESDYIDEIIMRSSIGTGKCQPLDTIIPTPIGDRRFGDLKVGDYVFDYHGKPTRVTGVYPRGIKDIYRVYFKDGTFLDVGDDHLWTLSIRTDKLNKTSRTFTTLELKHYLETNEEINKGQDIKFFWLPVIQEPLQYTDEHQPLCDPYVLGSLIADGSLKEMSKNRVVWTNSESSLLKEITSRCHQVYTRPGEIRHYILDKQVCNALEYYGLKGKGSREKFIHQDLFHMSPKNRLLLLQGLMDGDGSPLRYDRIGKQYTPFKYCTMSKQLAADVQRLVTSLGGYASIFDEDYGSSSIGYYEPCKGVMISTNFNIFKASHWKELWDLNKDLQKMQKHNRRIERIDLLPEQKECQCIMVDSPEHLYVGDAQFNILTHNTSFCNAVLIRKLYELSCYTDIRPLYNLMSSKKLLMVYFSITREVAENTGYAQLRDMLFNIPYFQDYFSPNTRKSYDIEFPDYNMAITSGSRALNALGGDVIASVIDEGDFYDSAGSQDAVGTKSLSKAQSLYASIRKRARSRFMVGGRNYSLNMIISSPTYASGFISQLIDENRGNPHAYIIEETLWTIKPKGTYSSNMFLVFKGTPMLDPQIVEDTDFFNTLLTSSYLPIKEFKSTNPIDALVELPQDLQQLFVQVPIDFKKDFEIDLITALQDIASVPTSPLGRLFTSEKYYAKAAILDSPFTQDKITISTNKMDDRTVQFYFKNDYKPLHPELPRFIHFDLSLTGDEAGVACSFAEVLDRDSEGNVTKKVTTEWMMQVVPPKKPEEIDLKKMRSICYYLRDTLHLNIALITFDSFASEEAIQSLRQDGFTVERQSLDRDDKAYTDIMQLYYQELYQHPDHPRYKEELFNLIHYRSKHKVDHPSNLDKGITDAAIGSAYSALIRNDITAYLRQEDTKNMFNWF